MDCISITGHVPYPTPGREHICVKCGRVIERETLLKKSITYEDFNGKQVTEDFYFHLSKADLIELEMEHKGGLAKWLEEIVASEDGGAIIGQFKRLILSAYGKKSEDGRRFIKTQELRDEFQSTEAYSQMFFELCTDSDKAAEFVNAVIPAGLQDEMAKMPPVREIYPEANPTAIEEPITHNVFEGRSEAPKLLSVQQIAEMDSDELKSGLATGRYKLAP